MKDTQCPIRRPSDLPLRNEFQTKFAVAMHLQLPTLNTEDTHYLMVLVPISPCFRP